MLLYFLRLEEYFSVIICTFYIIDCVQGLEFFHCNFYIIRLEKNHFGPKSILLCTNRKWGFLQCAPYTIQLLWFLWYFFLCVPFGNKWPAICKKKSIVYRSVCLGLIERYQDSSLNAGTASTSKRFLQFLIYYKANLKTSPQVYFESSHVLIRTACSILLGW